MLHDNVKTFDVIFKKMEESTRAVELALEGHSLFLVRNTILTLTHQSVASDLKLIDRFSIVSCCIDCFRNISAREKTNRWEPF